MHSSSIDTHPTAIDVHVDEQRLTVDLADGRTIAAPLAWYPRLAHATAAERESWRIIGAGGGVHWPDLDEDVSVQNILAGVPSTETQASFKQWLSTRPKLPSS
jgi:hypothetical protein